MHVCVVVREDAGQDRVLQVSPHGDSLYCPGRSIDELVKYDFDGVDSVPSEQMLRIDWEAAGLADRACNGQPAAVLVVGEDSVGKDGVFFGLHGSYHSGIIESTAARVFERLQNQDEVRSVARVSWYRLDREDIVDVLRQAGSQRKGPSKSDAEGARGPVLALRDDDELGLVVPGLWEVEVSSARDVHKLLECALPHAHASGDDGAPPGHHVVTLSIHRHPVVPAELEASQRATAPRATVSQLSFVLLGNASLPDTGPGAAPDGVQQWVRSLQMVLRGLERREPSVAFSSSKVTRLLQRPLRGEVASLLVACAPQGMENLPAAIATVKFANRLRRLTRGPSTATATPAPPAAAPSQSRVTFADVSDADVAELTRSDLAAHSYGGASSWAPDASAAATAPPHPADSRISFRSEEPSFPLAPSGAHEWEDEGRGGGGGEGGGGGGAVDSSVLQNSPVARASRMLTGRDPRVVPAEAARTPEPVQLHAPPAPGSQHGWMESMLASVEEARARAASVERRCAELEAENDALRQHLHAAQTRLHEWEEDRRAGDGALPAQTRKRLRHLQAQVKKKDQEIADFELYRDVVEATLTRLRSTVQSLAAERDETKKQLRTARTAIQREKTETQKQRDRVRELEMRLEAEALDFSRREETMKRSMDSLRDRARVQDMERSLETGVWHDEAAAAMEAARLRERASQALRHQRGTPHTPGANGGVGYGVERPEDVLAAGLRQEMSR